MRLVLLLTCTMLVSCGSKIAQEQLGVSNDTSEADLFSHKAVIKYAKNFSISYHDTYKVVDLHYESISRSYKVNEKWVLVQRGSTMPELSGDLAGAKVIEIPVRSIAVNNKAEMVRLKDLGSLDKVVAVGGADIYDDSIYHFLTLNKIPVVGYGADNPQQQELLLALNPDLYLFFTTEARGLELIAKHRQLGVHVVPHLGWCEPFFMAKVEWIKFTALFFNLEKEADAIVEMVNSNSEELMRKINARSDQPTAFMTFHPAGAYDWWAHRNDYFASLLDASGAVNVLADDGPTHYVPINHEQLLEEAHLAQYWFGNSETDTRWPPATYLNEFQSYSNGNVYHYNKRSAPERNAYDWQELAVARPDLVIQDLVSILYPEILPDHQLLFFEKVKLTKSK